MGKPPSDDKDGLKKGPWTPEEDQKLIDYIRKQGHGRWRTLPKNAGLKRCGKSCRLRWTNYLRPDIKRGRFSFEEEETIIQLHSVLGNKWSAIAARLPGRTDNEIKNYWNTHIRKRLLKMGIDPVTHTPRLDLLELSSLLNSTLYNSSSSQLSQNPSYLLGNMGPIVNQNLLSLATTLLSYQPKTNSSIATNTAACFVSENSNNTVQETLVLDQIVPQSQYQSFQQNQFQTCTTSSDYNVNDTQLMRAKLEQLSQTLMESYSTITTTSANNCPHNNANSSTNIWQKNNFQDQAFMASFDSRNPPSSIMNMSFSSLLSTPSSSPYVNHSGSTNNNTHEDERDSFCSNVFMYDIANFAFNGNELV